MRPLVSRATGILTSGLFVGILILGGLGHPGHADEAPDRVLDRGTHLAAQIDAAVEVDWIEQDRSYGQRPSKEAAAPKSPGATTSEDASGGCDGIKNGAWGFHVASGEKDPWWQVDLGEAMPLDRVVVFNRTDSNTAPRTKNLRVLVADAPEGEFRLVYQHDGTTFFGIREKKPLVVKLAAKNVSARIVRLQIPGNCSFALDEVEVYATEAPTKNIALGKPANQISVSQYSHPGTLGETSSASRADHLGRFAVSHIRTVLDRAKRLAARLEIAEAADDLGSLESRLMTIETSRAEPGKAAQQRKALYLDARRALRRIAWQNPLLKDIDKLLFIQRHDPGGPFHMCDQYYGCNAKPGGGLFVLRDPFGPEPELVDLLENSVVENGRLKGQKLTGGSFLSPEVSFDGKTILFAWTQCQAKSTYQWAPEYSFHIFRCNADGSGLRQLTDGPADDFDPCFLPNGRVVFITERRGGYLRCGRHCPVYTMFSMNDDGSDIICLSFHETHEWHPSVNNEGMLVYTRWDYVDRDTNVAHHIWTCYPDGRDPRSFHGNYPERRQSRPWMEMSIRAIPDSHKYVAVTGAHHGNAFGSLVVIDPRVEDDNSMSQLTRLTPDTPFPEAEATPIRNYMKYGTPWPLSEDDYLCVYSADATNRGIYWIDSDGNRELLYRDEVGKIPCLSPIPFGPRPTPPVIPDRTVQTLAAKEQAGGNAVPSTVAVMNVYDTDFEWPVDTEIDALRVIQVLPKTTPPPNEPRIGVAQQTNARAVLGTVPVERDGSAFFEVPPGRAIYFQALDSEGMAVQSMRSATYLHPGEQLTCNGCHEDKHSPPPMVTATPLAMRRAPSKLKPDVAASNPFNYARLVQPVLDRHCVACHREKKAIDLGGEPDGLFTRSYNNLAGEYGFYFHVSNGSINMGVHGGSRTIAGQFGARASKLLPYLDKRHHSVSLSREERHRITLWLDCNSEFLGAYEDAPSQIRGEVVQPSLH